MTNEYVKPTALASDHTWAIPPGVPFQKPLNVILVAGALTVFPTTAGASDTNVDGRRLASRWTNSGTILEQAHAAERVFAGVVLEVRRRSALTWEQLASVFGVDRRSVHLWASGRPMSAANAERLNRIVAILRRADRGTSSATKAWLHSPNARGLIPLDLLREGRFDEIVMPDAAAIRARPGTLSEAAKKSRAPASPEELIAARHDRAHIQKEKLIASMPLKVSKTK